MQTPFEATGQVCRFLGMWLIGTAGLLVWAQTAPSIDRPDWQPAMLCLLAGAVLFSVGCLCRSRRRR